MAVASEYEPYVYGKAENGVPTVYFHGLNDNCTNNAETVKYMSQYTNHSYVRCIEIGDGRKTTWWLHITKQAKMACELLLEDPVFS